MTLTVSETAVLAVLVKATAILAAGLCAAWLLRKSAASVQALVLVATFATLGLLPLAAVYAPALVVALPVPATGRTVPDAESLAPPVSAAARSEASVPRQVPVPEPRDRAAGATPFPAFGTATMLLVTLSSMWAIGMAVVLLPVIGTFWRLRGVRRVGVPWLAGQRHARRLAVEGGVTRPIAVARHEAVRVPMTCGLWQPVLLLPWDVEDWDEADVTRALVHEIEHIRRRDWLLILLTRVVCAAYWFHPVVWVAWRRLHLAMERACDDAVLGRCEGRAYAAQLVQLAQRLSTGERHALPAMASHGDLSVRVHAIIRPGARRRRVRAVETIAAAAAAMACLLVVAPLAAVAQPGQIPAQYETGGLAFEVVSIRPNPDPDVNIFVQLMRIRRERELFAPSVTVRDLIRYAYEYQFRPVSLIEGGPGWLDSERYEVIARATEPFGRAPGRGLLPRDAAAMLRALLVERMELTVRIETRERSVYALVLDRPDGQLGPNLAPARGDCQPSMATFDPEIPLPACPFRLIPMGTGSVYEMKGITMAELASTLGNYPDIDELVVDRTGLPGRYDMSVRSGGTMELSPFAPPVPRSVDSVESGEYPPIRIAMREQLGLRLERISAPVEAIVIESVERPSPN